MSKDRGKTDIKAKARQHVAKLVAQGILPHRDNVPCTDCGHISDKIWDFDLLKWIDVPGGSKERRMHDYDHHKGYEREHWADVEVVCRKCHARRGQARGETQCRLPLPEMLSRMDREEWAPLATILLG